MNMIWARFLIGLGFVAAAAGFLALFASPTVAIIFCAIVLLVMLLANIYQLQRLWKILNAPVYGEIPSAIGVWGEIYYRLHKLVKNWRAQMLAAEQQHTRFIQAIQASPNGVLMLDEDDQIEWCNSVVEVHLGLNAKRDIRQIVTHLIRTPDFVQYLHSQRYEEPLTMRNVGRYKQNIISVQLFPYGDNRKLLLTQDITQLEKTETMRRDFVANVSHELKTPLTVLAGFLETVRELPLSEADQKKYLEMMATQASRMQTLVSDLLVLANLEGNSQAPKDDVLSMPKVLTQLQHEAEVLSQGQHTINSEISDDSAQWHLIGTETELISAFTNLMSNAVRYSPAGTDIVLRWQADEQGGVFSVQDAGTGIAPEHIPRLTERFYRIDSSRSRDTGGTGLGLAIVKHALSRHQAYLTVESEAGHGSCFSAHFPTQRLRRALTE